MPDKSWKQAERRVAARFGSVRNPLSGGMSRHSRSDSLHPRLFLETKYSQRHPTVSLFKETIQLAKKEGKMPVVALVEARTSELYAVVPLDIEYLVRLVYELVENESKGDVHDE